VKDAEIAAVRVPTLRIIGSADPALAGMQDLKTVMPALSVIVIDGATHGGERGVLTCASFSPPGVDSHRMNSEFIGAYGYRSQLDSLQASGGAAVLDVRIRPGAECRASW
jgi:hypothetical protein